MRHYNKDIHIHYDISLVKLTFLYSEWIEAGTKFQNMGKQLEQCIEEGGVGMIIVIGKFELRKQKNQTYQIIMEETRTCQ